MSANEQVAARILLRELVNRLIQNQDITFKQLAERSGIPESTLRRPLNNPELNMSPRIRRGLERAFRWRVNEVDRFLDDPTHVPQLENPPLDPGTSTVEEVLKFLTEFAAAQRPAFDEVRAAVLDITNW
jgi:hypothetical protein